MVWPDVRLFIVTPAQTFILSAANGQQSQLKQCFFIMKQSIVNQKILINETGCSGFLNVSGSVLARCRAPSS
jgi:hypothetical protein